MEIDQLKSTWKTADAPAKTTAEFKNMLMESKHPVLKEIRKQFVLEIIGWSVFLLCYYTMFDGDRKPVIINLVLVASVLSSLIHNLSGYSFSRYLHKGDNIRTSLAHYLSKIKSYAAVSVITRIIFITGFLVFFTFNIKFTTGKYLLLATCGLVFSLQLIWLGRLWAKRISALGNTINNF